MKDWYRKFRPCDVCSVTHRSVYLNENYKISLIARQYLVYFSLKSQKMSDSESFESQRDTEQSTDNEDVVEPQSSLVQPYQFEPVADSD